MSRNEAGESPRTFGESRVAAEASAEEAGSTYPRIRVQL